MVLSVRSEPFIIPEYSLTGDMLSLSFVSFTLSISKQR